MNDSAPEHAFRGGSYEAVHNAIRGRHELPGGDVLQCHHVIPQHCLKACALDPAKGPTIQMRRSDHVDTGTYGKDEDAVDLRRRITDLLSVGDLDGAYTLGLDDVRGASFGAAYGQALEEAGAVLPGRVPRPDTSAAGETTWRGLKGAV